MALISAMQDISPARLVLIVTAGIILISSIRRLLKGRETIPKGAKPLPGPKGWPIVGNAFSIPKAHAWLKFKEWGDEYGPIYQLQAFGTTLVIISKESIANDLLSLRGAIYSDRPALIMPGLISDNGFLGAARWDSYWRRARKFTQSMLSSSSIQQSIPKQTTEARQMVVDLMKDPDEYTYWLERAGVMVSIKQIYGLDEERGPMEKEHVHGICGFMENIERVAITGAYLVEFIPWLLHLPTWLAPFKREAKHLVKQHWDYLAPLVRPQSDKQKTKEPQQPESFSQRFWNSKKDWNLDDREIVWALASIYGGAAGTSSTAMQSLILNMCLFPNWQKRVQDEVDQVVGDDRLPEFNDSSSLPAVRAVIKETMRWRPVLSGGFPHSVTKDDEYNGYHIPKGAVIIPNQWSILRDEEQYQDAESFKPERWLDPSFSTYQEPLTEYPNLKRFVAFGHGRRICPGLEVTEKALFLQFSSLLWACNIRRARDAGGKEIDVPFYDYTGVSISTPRKFRFAVEERKAGRLKLMEEAALKEHRAELAASKAS